MDKRPAAEYARRTIAALIHGRDMTWKHLADLTGLSLTRLYSISSSRRGPISVDELVLIAGALGVAPGVLLPVNPTADAVFNPEAVAQLLLGAAVQRHAEGGE